MTQLNQDTELLNQLRLLVFPKYIPGCSDQEFLQAHQPFFQILTKFDQDKYSLLNSFEQKQNQAILDAFTETIITFLNQSCTKCPRAIYSLTLFELIKQFKGNLKNLAVGKLPINLSYRQRLICQKNCHQLFRQKLDLQLVTILDQYYLSSRRVPNRQIYYINYPQILRHKQKLQKQIFKQNSRIPITHLHYISVIAASTYGCRYMWNRSVEQFIKQGGDINWIKQGVSAAPAFFKSLSYFSSIIAYDFQKMLNLEVFKQNNQLQPQITIQYQYQAFLAIVYFHSLACLDMIFGFIPENIDNQIYIQNKVGLTPSLQSFMIMTKTEGINYGYQQKIAEQFQQLLSWQTDPLQVNFQQEQQQNIIRYKKSKSFQNFKQNQGDNTYLIGKLQEDQLYEKVTNLQTLKNIRKTYSKFANVDAFQNNITEMKQKRQSSQSSQQIQNNIILSADWNFSINTLNKIQLMLGSKYSNNIHGFITSLRMLDKQKSKLLKYYYQFFNGYMHEYLTYTQLLKQITISQRNYLKILTKSPFLVNEQTFIKIQQDLKKNNIKIKQFTLQAISYKFQLNIIMLNYIFNQFDKSKDI